MQDLSTPNGRGGKDIYGRALCLRREILLTGVGILVTCAASVLLARECFLNVNEAIEWGVTGVLIEQATFALLAALLVAGNLAYQISRAAYFARLGRHQPVPRHELDRLFETKAPRLTLLVPSFREEERTIRQALWSAALQDYPDKRVVLLIDDPPTSDSFQEWASLETARRLPGTIRRALAAPAARMSRAVDAFIRRKLAGPVDVPGECRRLAALHRDAACWFEQRAGETTGADHVDRRFIAITFSRPAREHRHRAAALDRLADSGTVDESLLVREYRRLGALFAAELSAFERKRYANLSHAPNKAMNLNCYIGLLGGRFQEVVRRDGLHLEASADGLLTIEQADYLITLDADSYLMPDYALRLVHVMEQEGNERLAVVQTPYSAVEGPAAPIERIAGATTDMQYIVHQGFTRFGATFWVGANALLRTAALRDIRTTRREEGREVLVFISDRTVIEDTESSVDLVVRGWTLYNYPERLSYSATPSDFGALLVQRRRWANGGLIILPKLLRHVLRGPVRLQWMMETFLRTHYLTSIASVNVVVPILLVYPFEENLRSPWFPLTAIPYFFLYGRDMVLAGYRWIDLPRVYALNLMLIPVHLGGVLKSIQQGLTGARIPFRRTPKVGGVTTAPLVYIAAEVVLTVYCLALAAVDGYAGLWMHALFLLANGLLLLYALAAFVRPLEASGYAGRDVRAEEGVPESPAHGVSS